MAAILPGAKTVLCNVRKVWGSAVRTYGVSQQALGAAGGLGQESPMAVRSHFCLFCLFLMLLSHLQKVNQEGIWKRLPSEQACVKGFAQGSF